MIWKCTEYVSGHPAGAVCIQPCLAELVVGSEIARDRDCDLGQLTDRMWLSSGQGIRKTNHYPHTSDVRENDWEVDYYLRMRRAASPRAKVGRRGPRVLIDTRASIHIIYFIYIRGEMRSSPFPTELRYLPSSCTDSWVSTGVSLSGNDTKDPRPPRNKF